MAARNRKKRMCFVIAPIGKERSRVRKRSDVVFAIIEHAVEPLGYKPIRADHIAETGLITRQVIRYLIDAPLVIADLSGANPNVYYELAIRHAFGKPVVQIIGKRESVPFDVRELRTVEFDPRDQYAAEEKIAKFVEAIDKPGFKEETPVTVARRIR